MRKLALHWKIIIGMVLGVLYGLIASKMGWVDFTNDWIKPWGKIFINLLKLIAVPLVFASLIKGVSSLSDISKLSRIEGVYKLGAPHFFIIFIRTLQTPLIRKYERVHFYPRRTSRSPNR